MILTAPIHRRRHSRAELERMNAGLTASRDRAVTSARQARDNAQADALQHAAQHLERVAAGYDEDARYLDRVSDGRSSSNLDAHQRRTVADELRNCARDLEHRCR